MYETYYGFAEKPFSLTPDPKFLYRSQSHGDAFDLLQYAVRRREGFVVVTGDIGTGKTTLCRALLEQIDRTTFTALVLNPFLSEEDLLKRILLDFGVISREDVKSGRLSRVTKQELIDALYDFLLGLIPLEASAVLIIDEAQNLPLPVLEQIRILSNLETDKEKLLQIILVGQLELQQVLRGPQLRQLDQRVSIRYQLEPLDREAVGAYVSHRLAVAGGSSSVAFTRKALDRVHRLSFGIPRLINLLCDRALLAGYSAQSRRITPEMVAHAAASLELQAPVRRRWPAWLRRHAALFAATAVVLLSSTLGAGLSALVYQRYASQTPVVDARIADSRRPAATLARATDAVHPLTILVGTFPTADTATPDAVRSLTTSIESLGLTAFTENAPAASGWQRVFAGSYADVETARRDLDRLRAAIPSVDARVVAADEAHPAGESR